MSLVSNNIRTLRKKHHFTQEQFAQKMQIKRSLIGAYEEGRAEPRLDYLKKMAEIFGITVDELISENVPPTHPEENPLKNENHEIYQETRSFTLQKNIPDDPIASTDLGHFFEIPFVGIGDYEKYRFNFADPGYINKLKKVRIPLLNNEEPYRAFYLKDNPLTGFPSGTIVIGCLVKGWDAMQEGQPYMFLLKEDGLIFRKMEKGTDNKGQLKIYADDAAFSSFKVSFLEIMEIWQPESYILPNTNLPANKYPGRVASQRDLDNLNERVNALNQELEYLKRQFRKNF